MSHPQIDTYAGFARHLTQSVTVEQVAHERAGDITGRVPLYEVWSDFRRRYDARDVRTQCQRIRIGRINSELRKSARMRYLGPLPEHPLLGWLIRYKLRRLWDRFLPGDVEPLPDPPENIPDRLTTGERVYACVLFALAAIVVAGQIALRYGWTP